MALDHDTGRFCAADAEEEEEVPGAAVVAEVAAGVVVAVVVVAGVLGVGCGAAACGSEELPLSLKKKQINVSNMC